MCVYLCVDYSAVQLAGYLFPKSYEGIELKRTRLIPMKWQPFSPMTDSVHKLWID